MQFNSDYDMSIGLFLIATFFTIINIRLFKIYIHDYLGQINTRGVWTWQNDTQYHTFDLEMTSTTQYSVGSCWFPLIHNQN